LRHHQHAVLAPGGDVGVRQHFGGFRNASRQVTVGDRGGGGQG
jgi:hypothetical protein